MFDTPEWRAEWLKQHQNADYIVTTTDGRLVRAEYRVLDPNAKYPIAYTYPENDGFNLEPLNSYRLKAGSIGDTRRTELNRT